MAKVRIIRKLECSGGTHWNYWFYPQKKNWLGRWVTFGPSIGCLSMEEAQRWIKQAKGYEVVYES